MRVDQKDYPRRPEIIIRPCHGKNELVLASSGVGGCNGEQAMGQGAVLAAPRRAGAMA